MGQGGAGMCGRLLLCCEESIFTVSDKAANKICVRQSRDLSTLSLQTWMSARQEELGRRAATAAATSLPGASVAPAPRGCASSREAPSAKVCALGGLSRDAAGNWSRGESYSERVQPWNK